MRAILIAGLAISLLSACGGGKTLHDMRTSSGGPDDFSVLPTHALELPETLSILPAPTPGGSNITDPNPTGDAIAALGGRPSVASAGGIPAADSALVAQAGRYGTSPTIRADLAAIDANFRRRKSRGNFFNFLSGDRYFRAYASQSLDAYAELIRFRNAGVATPSAPPLAQ